jgi:hypothetical protein
VNSTLPKMIIYIKEMYYSILKIHVFHKTILRFNSTELGSVHSDQVSYHRRSTVAHITVRLAVSVTVRMVCYRDSS